MIEIMAFTNMMTPHHSVPRHRSLTEERLSKCYKNMLVGWMDGWMDGQTRLSTFVALQSANRNKAEGIVFTPSNLTSALNTRTDEVVNVCSRNLKVRRMTVC